MVTDVTSILAADPLAPPQGHDVPVMTPDITCAGHPVSVAVSASSKAAIAGSWRSLLRQRPWRGRMLAAESIPDTQTLTAEQELMAAEWHAALREAFTRLPRCCQQLLALLIGDQPLSKAEISVQLGISAASIGPRHGRCLSKLRRDPAIAALLDADNATDTGCPAQVMSGVITGTS